MRLGALTLLMAAIPAVAAAPTPDQRLAKLIGERHAEAPIECITPDLSAQPEIVDGTAIVYRGGQNRTYVNRLGGKCGQLRESRRITVVGSSGRLCRADPVRVSESTGADFGFCTLGDFTPYGR